MTATSRKIGARQDLIREGDRPGPVFVMLDGWACRYKLLPEGGRQIVAFLMPGDTCDMHVAVLAEMDHSIQTLTPARVATIARGDIHKLVTDHPQIAQALWSTQLVDESTLRAWIVSMGRRDSNARVAHLMCELYLRARNIGLVSGNNFEMPLSQVVLADALGLTPVHVNRVLRKLRLANVMEIRRGALNIIDPVGLATIAGFDENYLHRRLRQAA
ncbi:Crp/Fnr family transcriptional regulator [Sphingomonas koreensis]|nr:Crp/Fnr family transcriptional regulator [Sphingomonas koreensis]